MTSLMFLQSVGSRVRFPNKGHKTSNIVITSSADKHPGTKKMVNNSKICCPASYYLEKPSVPKKLFCCFPFHSHVQYFPFVYFVLYALYYLVLIMNLASECVEGKLRIKFNFKELIFVLFLNYGNVCSEQINN